MLPLRQIRSTFSVQPHSVVDNLALLRATQRPLSCSGISTYTTDNNGINRHKIALIIAHGSNDPSTDRTETLNLEGKVLRALNPDEGIT